MMKKILYLFFFFMSGVVGAVGNEQSGQEKATLCAACHGPTGVSVNPAWPNLAGQHTTYLIKQLHDLKEGKLRHSPIMAPFVAALTDDDMASLALFYSKQSTPKHHADKENTRGAQLYRAGDMKKHIAACIACHGPRGRGNDLAGFPILSGQQVDYSIQQLQAFQEKSRRNDLNSMMRMISARMSDDDMKAVSRYASSLH
jgi:cytochrome c553